MKEYLHFIAWWFKRIKIPYEGKLFGLGIGTMLYGVFYGVQTGWINHMDEVWELIHTGTYILLTVPFKYVFIDGIKDKFREYRREKENTFDRLKNRRYRDY